jgi:16S rRNA (cytosine967-C5)-methyltransferase
MKASAGLAPVLQEAALKIARVVAGRSLAEELEQRASTTPRGALIDLTHGTLRRYGRVQWLVEALSRRARPDRHVEALLWCSFYALESGRYAHYTVVDQAVRACGLLERWGAKPYVNAVLRAYLRQRATLEPRIAADPVAHWQHPRWWIEALQRAHPTDWQGALEAGNGPPPMSLRVNRRRVGVEAYAARLAELGIASRSLGAAALLLERPQPVEALPGFAEGEVSVQDASAQRAAACLDLAAGQRVLDACAAPGGKSGHILELADVALTALDSDEIRCARLAQNLARLRLRADVRRADCMQLGEWWSGEPFHRILADVPCTASGIARRHPDVKWLRRESDVASFAERQGAILDALWRTLAPGGKLLYVTCSVFPGENEEVVEAFVARAPGARRLALPDGAPGQSLPGPERDGFFHALLARQA